jgi:putative phage-type endonuclease
MNRIVLGSEEWKRKRRECVTATDAPIIMGVSPWCTRERLMKNKVLGIETPKTWAMERGLQLEEAARSLFEKRNSLFVCPEFLVHPALDWLAASPDGWNESGALLEIKCPGNVDHASAKDGIVPAKYMPQVQTQMIVAEQKKMFYVSYRPEDDEPYVQFEVGLDQAYCAPMLERLAEFHLELMTKKAQDYDFHQLSQEDIDDEQTLLHFMNQKKEAEGFIDKLRQKLIDKCDGRATEGMFLRLTPTTFKGSIDYKAIPELKNVNLEDYRRPSSIRWDIEPI